MPSYLLTLRKPLGCWYAYLCMTNTGMLLTGTVQFLVNYFMFLLSFEVIITHMILSLVLRRAIL